jgi:hypothetical protein
MKNWRAIPAAGTAFFLVFRTGAILPFASGLKFGISNLRFEI